MLIKKLTKLMAITAFTIPFTALAKNVAVIQPQHIIGHLYYQCSSHHTEDDFRIHYGFPSDPEWMAQVSASGFAIWRSAVLVKENFRVLKNTNLMSLPEEDVRADF